MHRGAPVREAIAQPVARGRRLLAFLVVAAWFSVGPGRWRGLRRSIGGARKSTCWRGRGSGRRWWSGTRVFCGTSRCRCQRSGVLRLCSAVVSRLCSDSRVRGRWPPCAYQCMAWVYRSWTVVFCTVAVVLSCYLSVVKVIRSATRGARGTKRLVKMFNKNQPI